MSDTFSVSNRNVVSLLLGPSIRLIERYLYLIKQFFQPRINEQHKIMISRILDLL